MKFKENEQGIYLYGEKSFNITHIFECGQCFRFKREEDGSYTLNACGRVINISRLENGFLFKNTNADDFLNIWVNYFDLERDYEKIKTEIAKDDIIKKAVDFGYGIRLLRQDPFETVISFIISQRNSIPKIKKVVALLCENFGKEIDFGGKKHYAFPTCDTLASLDVSDLAILKCGYRDKYIIDAAKKVKNGTVNLNKIGNLPYSEAKAELLKIYGVGSKVADCILLFAYGKYNSFPVDTWVKKVMLRYNVAEKDIHSFCNEYFGENAGFAQQYLFYCERESGFDS